MKNLLLLLLLGLLVPAVVSRAALPSETQAGKIRVLLTYGGHGFEQAPFFALFESIPDVEVTRAELPKQFDLLKPGLEKRYDVIVRYDMCPKITPAQRKAFVELLNRGIGLVALHHNVGAHREWDEYRKIIGGKFIFGPCTIDGKRYARTPWSHGEHLDVVVADRRHPITRGIADFKIHDETYGPFYVAEGVHVLLTTDHPKNNRVVAWTTKYGRSPVFYLMFGHDHFAYENPSYRKLVAQGIRWAAGKR